MGRQEYDIKITVNGRRINKVIIDSHYEEKHSDSVDDQIVLGLVRQLDGQFFEPDGSDATYTYFVIDKMLFDKNLYKLVWLLEENKLYIGIVNAYRR